MLINVRGPREQCGHLALTSMGCSFMDLQFKRNSSGSFSALTKRWGVLPSVKPDRQAASPADSILPGGKSARHRTFAMKTIRLPARAPSTRIQMSYFFGFLRLAPVFGETSSADESLPFSGPAVCARICSFNFFFISSGVGLAMWVATVQV